MGSLEGRTALVTGGAGLIGSAISWQLARMGAAVVLNGRDPEKLGARAGEIRDAGYRAHAVPADVTKEEDVARLFAEAGEWAGGPVHVVINNAGGGAGSLLHEMTLERWNQALALNLTAAFLCSRAAVPGMRDAGFGRLIAISSLGYVGVVGQGAYAAAKAGLEGLSNSLALENADFGITSNVVVPHLVRSPRHAQRDPAINELLLDEAVIRRFGEPEEIATAVGWLAAPEAAFVTGEVLHVTGGMKIVSPNLDVSAGIRPRQR